MNSCALGKFALFIQQTCWALCCGPRTLMGTGGSKMIIENNFPPGNQKFTISCCKFYLRGKRKGLFEARGAGWTLPGRTEERNEDMGCDTGAQFWIMSVMKNEKRKYIIFVKCYLTNLIPNYLAFSLCTTAPRVSLDTIHIHFRGKIELKGRYITWMDWI